MQNPYQKNTLNKNIHGLRGFAAFSVLFYHIYLGAKSAGAGHISNGWGFWPEDAFHAIFGNILHTLNVGIEIFFIISGYLITASLIKSKSVKQFAINRCIRIYPVFIATQLAMFTIGPIIGWTWMRDLSIFELVPHIFSNLLFLPGVLPFNIALPAAWTLSYEAFFYVIASLLFLFSQRSSRLSWFLLLGSVFIYTLFLFPIAIFFFVGAFCYWLVANNTNFLKKIINLPGLPLAFFILFIMGVYPDFYNTNKLFYLIVGGIGLVAFYSIEQGVGVVAWLMRSRFFQFLGSISYSLYLWQVPIMYPIKRGLLKYFPSQTDPIITFYLFAGISIFVCLLFSYISFKIFEDAIPRKIKNYLRTRRAKTVIQDRSFENS